MQRIKILLLAFFWALPAFCQQSVNGLSSYPSTPFSSPTVATPVDSPGAGSYGGAQTVTITDATPGAVICYRTDGVTITVTTTGTCPSGSTTYSGSFTSPAPPFTLTAVGTIYGWLTSAQDSSAYSSSAGAPTYASDVNSGGGLACYHTSTCSAAAITPATNDLLVATVGVNPAGGSATVSSISDTCGTSGGASNTYTTGPTAGASNYHVYSYWTIVGYGKSCVVKATMSGAGSEEMVHVIRVTGNNTSTPVGTSQDKAGFQSSGTAGTGANAVTSGALASSTTQTNTLEIGDCWDLGNSGTLSAGTGFTGGTAHNDGGNLYYFPEYQTLSSSGSTAAATCTSSSGTGPFGTVAIAIQHP